ncbi:MAG: MFS transporter [Bacteroidetes bacterium]|nr:MAG: MFS transporter [Bacteroidota bacterium]
MGLSRVFKKFPKTFWSANTMELLERWAWYGMFMVFALYLTGSRDTGALGFSQVQKGLMMGIGTAILYFLPVFTGAIADKIGYKKVLLVSFAILSTGYYMMGCFTTYTSMFIVFLYVAFGAALFKPIIAATISKTTNEETSSIGFGIYYMMVNIGAFIAPLIAAKLRVHNWQYVFSLSSAVIAINFIIVLFFYKEPDREKNDDTLRTSIIVILKNIGKTLMDIKFVIFLFLIIGFWTMYNQLFYTLPVFIDQWINTSVIYDAIASISPNLVAAIGTKEGLIPPEVITDIDAGYIIIFQILISSIVMKWKPLNTMITGIFICSFGMGLTFATQNGFYLFLSIFMFSVGEMASSPKITEYIGKIAPEGKTALYMGCSFIPMAGGNFFAGLISGNLYGAVSDKITLLKTEVASRGLDIPQISANFTQNDYFNRAAELIGVDKQTLTNMLWEKYHPSNIWYVISGIGIITVVGLLLYDRLLLKEKA